MHSNGVGAGPPAAPLSFPGAVLSRGLQLVENMPSFAELQLRIRRAVWMANPFAGGRKEEAQQRILEALRRGSTELDIGLPLNLDELPPGIGKLQQLRALYLTHSSLCTLSSEIGQLTQLRTLCLSENDLDRLPPEIAQLSLLQDLGLARNRIRVIPSTIICLTRLKELDIRFNPIRRLPPEISRLTELEVFLAEYCPLESLPQEFWQLRKLKHLQLNNTRLTTLSARIGELEQLEELNLAHTRISSLPPEVGQMERLWNLSLYDNPALSTLPMALGQLPHLEYLSITGTQISPEVRNAILASTQELRRQGAEVRDSLTRRLSIWQAVSGETFVLSRIQHFSHSEKATLDEWLSRLERTRDFQGQGQAVMARAVCEMLMEATTNSDFEEALLTQAEANNERCEDRAAMALNELYTFLKLTQLDEDASLQEQLTILVSAAKTTALRSAIGRCIAARRRTMGMGWSLHETVEIYLFFEIELKGRLDLLSITSEMSHAEIGDVSWIDLEGLLAEVNRTYLDHLVTLPAFEKLAEETREYRQRHEEEYEALHDQMAAIDPRLPGGERRAREEELGRQWKALEIQHKKEWVLSLLLI